MTSPPPGPTTLQIAAKKYLDMGCSLIPIKPMDKQPDLTKWGQYQNRRPTEKEALDWFFIAKNIAILCGEVSGGLFVQDFDDLMAFRYCWGGDPELPNKTLVVETSRGVHVYLRVKGGGKPESTTFRQITEGQLAYLPVDVQGHGKYVVAPPSVHPSGKTYGFLGEARTIQEVDYPRIMKQLAAWAQEWPAVKLMLEAWKQGVRQNLALGFSAYLWKVRKFSKTRVLAIIGNTARTAGDDEVDKRMEAARDTMEKDPDDAAVKLWLGEEIHGKLMALTPKRPPKKEDGQDPEDADHGWYATELMKKYTFATMSDTLEIYVYVDGVYKPLGERLIRSEVEASFQQEYNTAARHRFVDEVVHTIERRSFTERDKFNPPGLLCFKSGVLALATLGMMPHTPNPRFITQLPVAYDPSAPCPLFLKFLEEILPDATSRALIQMLFGYTLEDGYPYQKAFMFVGPGNNGKTTLMNVQEDLLGRENVSHESFQALSDQRFAAASLYGKLANICGDLPRTAVKYTGVFKMVTGGDTLKGEKKFRDAFSFKNRAKVIFSANELPEVNDRTRAFWRRWILLRFPIDIQNPDSRMRDKLRAELAGILNWSLEGLKTLRAAGGFPEPQEVEENREEWKRESDSLYWFISEYVEKDVNGSVAKADFYQAYRAFCEGHNLRAKSPEAIGKDLPQHIPSIRTQRAGEKGARVWVWSGVRLKEGTLDTLATLDTEGVKDGEKGAKDGKKGDGVQGVQASIDGSTQEASAKAPAPTVSEIGTHPPSPPRDDLQELAVNVKVAVHGKTDSEGWFYPWVLSGGLQVHFELHLKELIGAGLVEQRKDREGKEERAFRVALKGRGGGGP